MPVAATPPRGPWKKVWLLTAALMVVILGGLELFWRARGHTPSITPSVQLWCYHRDRLTGAGRDTIALLGGSRMQIGFDLDAFHERHPRYELVQLSLPAEGPFATLRDLANDESFHGTVICSLEELAMRPVLLEGQQPYVDYFQEKWGPGKKASLLLSVVPETTLAQLQPRLGGTQLLTFLRRRMLPLVAYTKTLFNRRRIADYTDVDVEDLIQTRVNYNRAHLLEHPPHEDEWQQAVEQLADFVRRIEARGGRVAVVKFPVAGTFLQLQNEFFPRDKYWDRLAAGVGTDVIHYEEMPGYEELHLPDDSHLDAEGARVFTLWLAGELERRDIIER